jgi:hypothetical protein
MPERGCKEVKWLDKLSSLDRNMGKKEKGKGHEDDSDGYLYAQS